MSDPLRQVALRRDIKLLQAANECYCFIPTLFKPATPSYALRDCLHPQNEAPQARRVQITTARSQGLILMKY